MPVCGALLMIEGQTLGTGPYHNYVRCDNEATVAVLLPGQGPTLPPEQVMMCPDCAAQAADRHGVMPLARQLAEEITALEHQADTVRMWAARWQDRWPGIATFLSDVADHLDQYITEVAHSVNPPG